MRPVSLDTGAAGRVLASVVRIHIQVRAAARSHWNVCHQRGLQSCTLAVTEAAGDACSNRNGPHACRVTESSRGRVRWPNVCMQRCCTPIGMASESTKQRVGTAACSCRQEAGKSRPQSRGEFVACLPQPRIDDAALPSARSQEGQQVLCRQERAYGHLHQQFGATQRTIGGMREGTTALPILRCSNGVHQRRFVSADRKRHLQAGVLVLLIKQLLVPHLVPIGRNLVLRPCN